ncbi:MAG: hypothetical protein AB8G99_00915, partial [Planctomycetaceae bacterium]
MYRIPCPSCSKTLKFKDASRIGRKAKCPKCGHLFVVTLPGSEDTDEVEMELVQPTPVDPMEGTSARWIPDEPTNPGFESPTAIPDFETTVPREVAAPVSPAAPLFIAPDDAVPSPISKLRERNKRRGRFGWVFALFGVLLVGGIGLAAYVYQGTQSAEVTKNKLVENKEWTAEKKSLEAAAVAAQDVSPTDGDPIDLKYLPPGASIIVHLHPSELWSDDDSRREFIFALGPLGKWLEGRVQTLTRFEPKEIEQLTIAIGLGPRESEPEISAVVRLHEAQQRSVFIRQRVKGQRDPAYTRDVYVGDANAWLLVDDKTFVVGPAHLAADLVASVEYAADPSEDLRLMIEKTDANRHVTVMVDRSALEIHTSELFYESVQTAFEKFNDWLGKDVDSVTASLHLGDQFFLETLFRSGTGTTPGKLNRHIRSRVDELPVDVLEMARLMTPRRKGARQIIARFPAMLQAVAAASDSGIGERWVQLTTVLPERAIPNLAVGTILTWNESTRTDFSRERTTSAAPQTKKPTRPTTLAERLGMKIELEFNRTPLQEAFAMLGEDVGITFKL